jgi:hypothetical protein
MALLLALVTLPVALAMSGAQNGRPLRRRPAPAPRAAPSTPPSVSLAVQASGLATTFMNQFLAGDFTDQWPELAPETQAMWPSSLARAAMLQAKFVGASAITSFTVGQVAARVTWTSQESPTWSVSGAYAVPVAVQFAAPTALEPAGVATDFLRESIVVGEFPIPFQVVGISHHSTAYQLRVVGEGPASLDAPIIEPSAPLQRSANVPILMYHLVGTFPVRTTYSNYYSYRLDYGLTVTPTQFSEQIRFLQSNGYTSISLNRLADDHLYGLPLPPRPVILTFDDGFLSEYQNAVPILAAANYTAVFFPCAGLIGATSGHESYMTASDLAGLANSGFWVQDHTVNDGTSLWGRSVAEMDYLAGDTAQTLEGITQQPVQFIAFSGLWPFPSATKVGPGQSELFSELPPLGYVGGLEDNDLPGAPWLESSFQLLELPRLRVFDNEPMTTFTSVLRRG